MNRLETILENGRVLTDGKCALASATSTDNANTRQGGTSTPRQPLVAGHSPVHIPNEMMDRDYGPSGAPGVERLSPVTAVDHGGDVVGDCEGKVETTGRISAGGARGSGTSGSTTRPTDLEDNLDSDKQNAVVVCGGQRNQAEPGCSPSEFNPDGASGLVPIAADRAVSPVAEVALDDAELVRRGFTQAQVTEAHFKAELCKRFVGLTGGSGGSGEKLSGNQAAMALGRPASWFSVNVPRYQAQGLSAFLPKEKSQITDYKLQTGEDGEGIWLPDWFIPAAQFYYLLSNKNRLGGSVPEAIRRTISLPACPPAVVTRLAKKLAPFNDRLKAELHAGWDHRGLPICSEELRESILAREKAGKQLLPPKLMKAISCSSVVVKQSRSKTDADLDYLSAPGSAMFQTKLVTKGNEGNEEQSLEREIIRGGEVIECDDGTINFVVCIPWKLGGCPCSDRYGVKVGRFQWLRAIDVGSRFRPAYVYVMRPRGSYRAEDVLSLLRAVVRTHGIPDAWRLERGIWEANRVKEAIRLMGSKLWQVYSPHQKPFVEGGFNTDWTKLSVYFPDAHVGRFQGENEEANKIYTACKNGQRDPRKYFPMLGDAIAAMNAITAEENRTPVKSQTYGRWVPEERWHAHLAEKPMRKLDPAMEWLFAPFVRELTVRGMLIRTFVRLFEGFSVPFDFSAEFLATEFHGARVKIYFDPTDLQCVATVVLAQNWRGMKEGTVIGQARQINEVAGYARFAMGYTDADAHMDERGAGRRAKQIAAGAMRREVRTIIGKSSKLQGVSTQPQSSNQIGDTSEMRDGLGQKAIIDLSPNPGASTALPVPVRREEPDFNTEPQRARREEEAERWERENSLNLS
jgi:hypothetical protein